MRFTDRVEAGKKLAEILSKKYQGKEVIVYGLPRGGVVTAKEVAKKFGAPLDLVITRKIGHPNQPEYALAAVSENGDIVGDKEEIHGVDQMWFREKVKKEQVEAKRRREVYVKNRASPSVKNKIAIIVDDGIATGFTMKAAIGELKRKKLQKIVVAAPVASEEIVKELKKEADDVIVLAVPSDFFAISNYYDEFPQVTDKEVISLLKSTDAVQ